MFELEPLSAGREEALFAQIAARTIDGPCAAIVCTEGVVKCGNMKEKGVGLAVQRRACLLVPTPLKQSQHERCTIWLQNLIGLNLSSS